jgi:Raf kinase inhibitor-like YbhB/YbcL family protein
MTSRAYARATVREPFDANAHGTGSSPGALGLRSWSTLVCVAELRLRSNAFAHGDEIPRRHTCDGADVSPALSWSDPPTGTTALALTVDDPDAPVGTFTHWLAWNIDPAIGELSEGEPAPAEGRNDFGTGGWSGPCPPPGHGPHRYFFRLYALDARLDVGFRAERRQLERALAGHVLATAELMGTYER